MNPGMMNDTNMVNMNMANMGMDGMDGGNSGMTRKFLNLKFNASMKQCTSFFRPLQLENDREKSF